MRNQGEIFQVSLHLPERRLNERDELVTESPGPLCLPPAQETWTSFPLQKGAQVLRATGRSLGFQLSFGSDVSTEGPNTPQSLVD